MKTNEITPEWLRAWRARRGFTQARAAAWYGVSERSWRRYEAGHIPPHVHRRFTIMQSYLKD
jgi:transcriptional regulator with XRE-family HTH domain